MENASTKNTYINVITAITVNFASHVDGVASISYEPGLNKVGFKKRKNTNAINVNILNNDMVKIEIMVNIFYGYKIPEVSYELQEVIKREVEKSTNYKVSSVDVYVVGVVSNY